MDPTLIHSSYSMSYPLTSDFKFPPSDRHYSTSLSSNDFVERRNGLASGTMSQSMTLGRQSNGIEYNAAQMQQHEAPCNTVSSLVLTPPQSGDESSSSATNPAPSSFTYSTQPKVSGSNVSGPEFYPSAASGYMQPNFNGGANMTQFDRRGALQIPAPLSPPYSYGPMSSSSFPPFHMARNSGFHFPPPRETYDIFNTRRFTPTTNTMTLSASLPYTPVHHQPPPRPEGPPFEDTAKVHSLVNTRGQPLVVDILASIPKGFFRVDDKWTCYRRNYFNVSCGFTFKTQSLDSQVFLSRYQHAEQVHGYTVSISAKTAAANNSESETRGLVQHTPKRDKATESIPTRHAVVPTPAQSMPNGHGLAPNGLYSSNAHLATCLSTPLDTFGHSAAQSPQTNYTFERIQFQKATANNGKRRAQQQYFHVVVKLEVNVGRPGGSDEWVVVATKQSHPMVVRGRSPGHYKDNRRDSQSSMDPDNGCGHSGGNPPTSFSLHPLGPAHGTGINGATSHYRHNHHYGTSFSHSSHRLEEAESSSTSPESSTTLEVSPEKGENYHIPCNVTRTTLPDASLDRIVLSPILSKINSDAMGYHLNKKRPFEDDTADCASSFFNSSLEGGYHNPSFDFSATSSSQALCASS